MRGSSRKLVLAGVEQQPSEGPRVWIDESHSLTGARMKLKVLISALAPHSVFHLLHLGEMSGEQ